MRKLWATIGGLVIGGGVAGLIWGGPSCAEPEVRARPALAAPDFDGLDATRRRIPVALVPVAEGLREPTDIQAVPGHPRLLVVLEKAGVARLVDLGKGAVGQWFTVEVNTRSEQGLLGLAFHPDFAKSGRLFLNYTRDVDGRRVTRIAEWRGPTDPGAGPPAEVRVLLEVAQPWANHNAGQLAFGPDGMLYVGFGDGGAADDPKGHGQDRSTLLGSMLRIDVDQPGASRAVPPDNPFVGQPGIRPEIWAYGLRNPWRYSFAPDGRLVVGDVGQNRLEEITIVGRGENHGWNRREANQCFPAGSTCDPRGLVDPVYTYTHAEDGFSVTGGYVYTGAAVPALKGKYVFGDFGTGRLWAIDLPPSGAVPKAKAFALGRWPINPSTFGVGADGTLYVADYNQGRLLAVAQP